MVSIGKKFSYVLKFECTEIINQHIMFVHKEKTFNFHENDLRVLKIY